MNEHWQCRLQVITTQKIFDFLLSARRVKISCEFFRLNEKFKTIYKQIITF